MGSSSTQISALRGMDIYEPFHQMSSWGDTFREDGSLYISLPAVVPVDTGPHNRIEYVSQESNERSRSDQEGNKQSDKESNERSRSDQEGNKLSDKTQRRLAQNREAARKSRMRKKAYVQQLETSRLKLVQLEQELERSRQQGLYISSTLASGHFGLPGPVNSVLVMI